MQCCVWVDWFKVEVMKGDDKVLVVLCVCEGCSDFKGNIIQGSGEVKLGYVVVMDNIMKKGIIIYCVGSSVVCDDGDCL